VSGWIAVETAGAWVLATVAGAVGALLIATGMVDELVEFARAAWHRDRHRPA